MDWKQEQGHAYAMDAPLDGLKERKNNYKLIILVDDSKKNMDW